MVVMEVNGNIMDDDRLLSGLWGRSSRSCRMVILHITQSSTTIGKINLNISKNTSNDNNNHNQSITAVLRYEKMASFYKNKGLTVGHHH